MTIGLRETLWVLVCEGSPRWAPALKSLVASAPSGGVVLRVASRTTRPADRSVRRLEAPVLLLAEIEPPELADALAWLTRVRRAGAAEPVALLGRGFRTERDSAPRVAEALRGAGAALVLHSPLELPTIPPLAERHARRVAERLDAGATPRESVWRRLPWQPPPGPLR